MRASAVLVVLVVLGLCALASTGCGGTTRPSADTPGTLRIEKLTGSVARFGSWQGYPLYGVRLRATVGEISDALEKIYGRHRADTQKVTGVYAAAYDSAEGWDALQHEIAAFGISGFPCRTVRARQAESRELLSQGQRQDFTGSRIASRFCASQ